MGCNIHLHTEIKVGGKWLHFSQPCIKRDYNLFGYMSGVRRVENFLFKTLKGLPEDMSETTKFCYDKDRKDSYLCGENYLTAAQIELLYDKRRKDDPDDYKWEHEQVGYLFGNGWNGWNENPECYPKEIEDIRWIFWFDN